MEGNPEKDQKEIQEKDKREIKKGNPEKDEKKSREESERNPGKGNPGKRGAQWCSVGGPAATEVSPRRCNYYYETVPRQNIADEAAASKYDTGTH